VSDFHEAKRYGSPKCFLICRRTFLSWELQSSFERESERRVEMTRERKRVFMLASARSRRPLLFALRFLIDGMQMFYLKGSSVFDMFVWL
jgi:hypothetical protein